MFVLDEGSCGGIRRLLGGKDAKLGDGRKPPDAPDLACRVRYALGSGEECFAIAQQSTCGVFAFCACPGVVFIGMHAA